MKFKNTYYPYPRFEKASQNVAKQFAICLQSCTNWSLLKTNLDQERFTLLTSFFLLMETDIPSTKLRLY